MDDGMMSDQDRQDMRSDVLSTIKTLERQRTATIFALFAALGASSYLWPQFKEAIQAPTVAIPAVLLALILFELMALRIDGWRRHLSMFMASTAQ